MRDTTWNGKVWKMYYLDKGMKVAKGMKMVLEERGISTAGKPVIGCVKHWVNILISETIKNCGSHKEE